MENYQEALRIACETISDIFGACPAGQYCIDLDCENKCEDQSVECWMKYFLMEADRSCRCESGS